MNGAPENDKATVILYMKYNKKTSVLSLSLFIALLVIHSHEAKGQVTQNTGHTPSGRADSSINYEAMGAPMPEMRLLKYIDTSNYVSTEDRSGLKKKKHKTKPAVKHTGKYTRQFVTGSDFENKGNLLVMMFNPNCSHCEDMADMFVRNCILFKKSELILMANPLTWDYIPLFYRSLHISDCPALTLGADSSDFINKVFLYKALPQINIYNRQRKLIKTFTGEVIIDSLKPYIQ